MANPDRVVALISDRTMQMNALFVRSGNTNSTVLGQIGIRVCDQTLRVFPNGTIAVSSALGGGAAALSATNNASAVLSSAFSVRRMGSNAIHVVAGSWRMRIIMAGRRYLNIDGISHLATNDTAVHGAYGVTARPDHHQRKKELCQTRLEGGCELPGQWQDYELPVGADLLSTQWKYSQSVGDSKRCAALLGDAAVLQKHEDDRFEKLHAQSRAMLDELQKQQK